MHNLVTIDLAEPHVIALAVGVKDINCDIGVTHLSDYGSKSSVSNIHSSIFFGSITDKRFSALKSMYVVLEDSHNFIFIEVRNPVEKSIEITCWISVESLAN